MRVTHNLVQRALRARVDLLEQAAGDWTRWASAKAPTPRGTDSINWSPASELRGKKVLALLLPNLEQGLKTRGMLSALHL